MKYPCLSYGSEKGVVTSLYLFSILMKCTNSCFLNEVRGSHLCECRRDGDRFYPLWNVRQVSIPATWDSSLEASLPSVCLSVCVYPPPPHPGLMSIWQPVPDDVKVWVIMQTIYVCVVWNGQINIGLLRWIWQVLYWWFLVIGEIQVHACGITVWLIRILLSCRT
jgi:hypothetical protein